MPDSVPPRPKAAVMTASRARSRYPNPPPWRSSASRARKSFAKPVGCCVALAGARDITPTYAPMVRGVGTPPSKRAKVELSTRQEITCTVNLA